MSRLLDNLIAAPSLKSLLRHIRLPAVLLALFSVPSLGQTAEVGYAKGFQLNRYEPTMMGEFSFLVDHPFYKGTKDFAAGFNFDYALNPWVTHDSKGEKVPLMKHLLAGHFGMSWSFWKRMNVSVSLPMTFFENGDVDKLNSIGISPSGPVVLGDPKVSIYGLLVGDPYLKPWSVSVGFDVWLPIRRWAYDTVQNDSGKSYLRTIPEQAGDVALRLQPKLMFGGVVGKPGHGFLWSTNFGFAIRPTAKLGVGLATLDNTIENQFELGVGLGYANVPKRLYLGTELKFGTNLIDPGAGPKALELTVLGLHVGVKNWKHWSLMFNGAVSVGGILPLGLSAAGIPDARVVLGISFDRYSTPKGQPMAVASYAIPQGPVPQGPLMTPGNSGFAPGAVPQGPLVTPGNSGFAPGPVTPGSSGFGLSPGVNPQQQAGQNGDYVLPQAPSLPPAQEQPYSQMQEGQPYVAPAQEGQYYPGSPVNVYVNQQGQYGATAAPAQSLPAETRPEADFQGGGLPALPFLSFPKDLQIPPRTSMDGGTDSAQAPSGSLGEISSGFRAEQDPANPDYKGTPNASPSLQSQSVGNVINDSSDVVD